MCEIRALFDQHGLRCTERRRLIYKALAASDRHPTAEELHERVRPMCDCVSLATVYNALDAFCRAGLCRKIPTSERGARFDADLRDHVHITTSDGAIVDLPDNLRDELIESLRVGALSKIERGVGVCIMRVRIELHGEPIGSENMDRPGVKNSAR